MILGLLAVLCMCNMGLRHIRTCILEISEKDTTLVRLHDYSILSYYNQHMADNLVPTVNKMDLDFHSSLPCSRKSFYLNYAILGLDMSYSRKFISWLWDWACWLNDGANLSLYPFSFLVLCIIYFSFSFEGYFLYHSYHITWVFFCSVIHICS